jgi:hypothetical protein
LSKKTYTKDFIKQVLEVFRFSPLEDYDEKVTAISQRYSVPRDELERWIRNEDGFLLPALPEDEIDALRLLKRKALEKLNERLENANAKDTAIIFGIVSDKLRLALGESTSNQSQHIVYERRGIDTLCEPTAPGAITGDSRAQALQLPVLRTALGEDSPGG